MPSEDTSDDAAANAARKSLMIRELSARKRSLSHTPALQRRTTSPRGASWRSDGASDAGIGDVTNAATGSGTLQMTSKSLTASLHHKVRSSLAQATERLKAAQESDSSADEWNTVSKCARTPPEESHQHRRLAALVAHPSRPHRCRTTPGW